MFLGKFDRRQFVERLVRSALIGVDPPSFNYLGRLDPIVKPARVQALIA